jgi:DNA-binding transcriptional LysR family regulator
VRIDARHRANNGQSLASLAVSGLGIVYSPDFIVANEIRAGLLVPLLTEYRGQRLPIAAVYPSRRHLSAKVRAVVDYLAARFEREQPWSLADSSSGLAP